MVDEEKEIPEDILNGDRYLPVADKRDRDLGYPLEFKLVTRYPVEHYNYLFREFW